MIENRPITNLVTHIVLILGVVAAVSLGSALLFQTPALKRIYRLDRD